MPLVDDSDDDEGEVPPLLGPGGASKPTLPSKPAPVKHVASPQPAADAAASTTATTTQATVAKPSDTAHPPTASEKPKPGANLKPSTGLRKGFLSGGGSSRSTNKVSSSSSSKSTAEGGNGSCRSSSGATDSMPTLRADQDAKAKSLQLPELQSALEADQAEAARFGIPQKSKNEWMTPDLLQKIAANPLLRKAFTDPRCQQAMAEMQTNPQEAMKKYGDNPQMREFLQAFMKLMGEHFTALADKQDAERKAAEEAALTPEQRKAKEVAETAMQDEEVRKIVQDPKVQQLLAQMQMGRPFELEQAMKSDPDLVRKLRKLSEAGLINMEWKH